MQVEGRDAIAQGLAHHQGLAVRRDDRTIGEEQAVCHHGDRSVRVDPCQAGGAHRGAGHQVETEITYIGAALLVHHHVVGMAAGHAGQIGMHHQAAVRLAAQQLAVAHGNDQ